MSCCPWQRKQKVEPAVTTVEEEEVGAETWHDRKRAAEVAGGRWAAECAVSLAFLLAFYEERLRGKTFRLKRGEEPNAAEVNVAGEDLTTGELVAEVIVRHTDDLRCRYAELLDPHHVWTPGREKAKFHFVSHAFGNPFSLVVEVLREHFALEQASEVFVWLDVFAINQHNTEAELQGGKALGDTLELSRDTLVVLDRGGLPLSRLWCLYEISRTPTDSLDLLLTRGASAGDVARLLQKINVTEARCFDKAAEELIRRDIVKRHQSESLLTEKLKSKVGSKLAGLVLRAEDASRFAGGVVEVEPGFGWSGPEGTDLAEKLAASASEDGAVCVWSLATGACVRVLVPPQPKKVWAVAPLGGALLATGGDDKILRVWHVASGREVARATLGDGQIRALAALPPGGPVMRVAAGTVSGVVGVWALLGAGSEAAGAAAPSVLELQTLLCGHDAGGEVKGLAVMATLPAASAGAAAGAQQQPPVVVGPQWLLASCSWDTTVRLWDVDGCPPGGAAAAAAEGADGGHNRAAAVAVLRGHTDRVVALAAIGPGRLASLADDKTLRFWGVSCSSSAGGGGEGSSPTKVEWRSLAIVDRPHGKELGRSLCDAGGGVAASGGMDLCVRLFAVKDSDLRTSQGTGRLGELPGHADMVRTVAAVVAQKGERRRVLVSGSLDNTLRIWDVQIPTEGASRPPQGRSIVLKGHAAAVLAVAVFSEDEAVGGRIATADAAKSSAELLQKRREGLELLKGLEPLRGGPAEPLNEKLAQLTVVQLRAVILALDGSQVPPVRAQKAAQLEAAARVVAAAWSG